LTALPTQPSLAASATLTDGSALACLGRAGQGCAAEDGGVSDRNEDISALSVAAVAAMTGAASIAARSSRAARATVTAVAGLTEGGTIGRATAATSAARTAVLTISAGATCAAAAATTTDRLVGEGALDERDFAGREINGAARSIASTTAISRGTALAACAALACLAGVTSLTS
jgi:hypothetical protein